MPNITAWFESLKPQTLDSIHVVYDRDAHFKDPFNDVTGIEKIRAIYAHMFANLIEPRFEITEVIEQSDNLAAQAHPDRSSLARKAFVSWRFKFEWRGQFFDIPGGTRFAINAQGLVIDHVDYWDVASGLYERLPLIGSLLRYLRQRMAAV